MARGVLGRGWKPDGISILIGIVVAVLLFGFTPMGQQAFYSITNVDEGWNGICTQAIIDECCEGNETETPPGEGGNCPDIDPADIPWEDHPYWWLENNGYDLVAACAEGDCDAPNEYCYPLIEWDSVRSDWFFTQCICLEASDLNCYDQNTEASCESHFCVGTQGYQQGYAKRCTWIGIDDGWACICPFDV